MRLHGAFLSDIVRTACRRRRRAPCAMGACQVSRMCRSGQLALGVTGGAWWVLARALTGACRAARAVAAAAAAHAGGARALHHQPDPAGGPAGAPVRGRRAVRARRAGRLPAGRAGAAARRRPGPQGFAGRLGLRRGRRPGRPVQRRNVGGPELGRADARVAAGHVRLRRGPGAGRACGSGGAAARAQRAGRGRGRVRRRERGPGAGAAVRVGPGQRRRRQQLPARAGRPDGRRWRRLGRRRRRRWRRRRRAAGQRAVADGAATRLALCDGQQRRARLAGAFAEPGLAGAPLLARVHAGAAGLRAPWC